MTMTPCMARLLLALTLLPPLLTAAPRSHARDHDRLPDRWEKRYHLSLDGQEVGAPGDRRPRSTQQPAPSIV